MRRLFVFGVLLAALWSVAWFSASRLLEAELARFTRDDGIILTDDVRLSFDQSLITGFPAAVEVTAVAPRVRSDHRLFSWTAGKVAFQSRLSALTTVTAEIGSPQQFALGSQELTYQGDPVTGSARVSTTALSLDEVRAQLGSGQLLSDWGWSALIDTASLSLARDPSQSERFKLMFSLMALSSDDISDGWPAAESPLPVSLQDIEIEANIRLSSELDRSMLSDMQEVEIVEFEITRISIRSDGFRVSLDGSVLWIPDAPPTGSIDVRIEEWRVLFDFIRRLGVIAEQDELFFETTLANMAGMSEGEDDISLPLTVESGVLRMGFLTFGLVPGRL